MAHDPLFSAHAQAFTEPEKLISAYFSSSTVGLGIVDTNLRYIAVNETLAQINGIPAAEHLGKTVREVLGDFASSIEPELRNVLSTGTASHFEISAKLPRREEAGHWIAHYIPIPDQSGKVTRVGVIVVEITAQKRLEQTLHATGERLDQEIRKVQMLLEVSRLLSDNRDLPKVFPQISARIRRVLRQEYASFAIHDADAGGLVRQSLDFPLGKGFTSSLPVAHNCPASAALETGVSRIFNRDEIQSFQGEIARSFLAEGLQSLCCVPLVRPQGPLGVFVLGSTRKDAFHAEDLNVLEQVAAQLAIAMENHRAASEIEALKQRLGEELKYPQGKSAAAGEFPEMVGESPTLRLVLDQVATVASSEATVLILGETGTGKELVARAIHRISPRKNGQFVKVNCAAIPMGLLESELFGHEKGAFTGAINQKIGRMELADGGTLLLDEVGEIPLELQPKLLRVLQDGEFERLGSNRTIKVNVRLLAATNRNLAESIAKREFRSDLFYRLSVFPIVLPPLRERPEDIPLLVRHFVNKFASRMNRAIETMPKEAMQALKEWHWPGNVRELENLIERSVILSDGPVLRVPLSDLRLSHESPAPSADGTLNNAERRHIIRILCESGGVVSAAAAKLGVKRTTLQSKMERLNITRRDYGRPRNK